MSWYKRKMRLYLHKSFKCETISRINNISFFPIVYRAESESDNVLQSVSIPSDVRQRPEDCTDGIDGGACHSQGDIGRLSNHGHLGHCTPTPGINI